MTIQLASPLTRAGVGPGIGSVGGWIAAALVVTTLIGVTRWISTRRRH